MSLRVRQTEYAASEATKAPASTTTAKNDKQLQTAFDEEVTVINNDTDKKQTNIDANNAQASSNGSIIEKSAAALTAIGNEISDLVNSNSVISGLIETAQSAIGAIEKKIDGITSKINDILGKEGEDADVSDLENQVKALQEDKAQEQKTIKEQEEELQENNAEIKDLTEEQEDVQDEIEALEDENATLEGKSEELQEGIEENEEEIDELEKELDKELKSAKADEVSETDKAEAAEANADEVTGEDETGEALEADELVAAEDDLLAGEEAGEAAGTLETDETPTSDLLIAETPAAETPVAAADEEDANNSDLILVGEEIADTASEIAQIAFEQGTTVEIVEAAKTYEDMGLTIDVQTIANASAIELDEIVENAIVQDVIKTSSSKLMGKVGTITNKKQMKENAKAVEAFQNNFITLENYYNTNDVYNAEAKGFITIAKVMYSNLAQGATYATSDIQQASDMALKLTSSLQSEVTASNATQDIDTQFEDTKTKAKNELDLAKAEVGEEENDGLALCETEFITLTSNYRNATTDAEKQKMIDELLEVITDARSIKENPESKIFNDERLVVTL